MSKDLKLIKPPTDDELIVGLWMEGKSSPEIAKALGRSTSSISNRIGRMRKLGVNLVRRRRSLDVEKLNRMIKGC